MQRLHLEERDQHRVGVHNVGRTGSRKSKSWVYGSFILFYQSSTELLDHTGESGSICSHWSIQLMEGKCRCELCRTTYLFCFTIVPRAQVIDRDSMMVGVVQRQNKRGCIGSLVQWSYKGLTENRRCPTESYITLYMHLCHNVLGKPILQQNI